MKRVIHVDFIYDGKPYVAQGRIVDGVYVLTVLWIKYRRAGHPGWIQRPIYERCSAKAPGEYVGRVMLAAYEVLRSDVQEE